jgi:hypothetical protein
MAFRRGSSKSHKNGGSGRLDLLPSHQFDISGGQDPPQPQRRGIYVKTYAIDVNYTSRTPEEGAHAQPKLAKRASYHHHHHHHHHHRLYIQHSLIGRAQSSCKLYTCDL